VWAFQPIKPWYLYKLWSIAKIVELEPLSKVTWEVAAFPGMYARHTYHMEDLGTTGRVSEPGRRRWARVFTSCGGSGSHTLRCQRLLTRGCEETRSSVQAERAATQVKHSVGRILDNPARVYVPCSSEEEDKESYYRPDRPPGANVCDAKGCQLI
jgi:hypothetical protein